MLMNETCKMTNLTKKAIEYYIKQGFVSPAILENRYRDFSEIDVERLQKISVLRRLGLNMTDIKTVLSDDTGDALRKIAIRKELSIQSETAKKVVLDKLSCGKVYDNIDAELAAIEQAFTITERLLESFPGYYGNFICLHFARFLDQPIQTGDERCAYNEIIEWLDNAPALELPEDLQVFLDENIKHFNAQIINTALEQTKQSIENPDNFLSENKDNLERYLAFKQSDEYKNSPLSRIQTFLKEFNNASGYYDAFIPAMKRLSKSYAEYSKQMELANEIFLSQYPQVKQWGTVSSNQS